MTMVSDLILIGSGRHSHACIDVIEQCGTHKICGLIGLPEEVGKCVQGYPVAGSDTNIEGMKRPDLMAFVCLGQTKSAYARRKAFDYLKELEFEVPNFLSGRAHVARSCHVDEGVIAMPLSHLGANVIVGKNCIINSGAIVEHDAVIAPHCHISTNATVNGSCKIGEGTFVGSGAVVRDGVTIGTNSVIGMGVVVNNDLPDDTLIRMSGSSFQIETLNLD